MVGIIDDTTEKFYIIEDHELNDAKEQLKGHKLTILKGLKLQSVTTEIVPDKNNYLDYEIIK